jgi:hypothetical protein
MGTDPFPEHAIFGIQKDGKFQKLGNAKFSIPSQNPLKLAWYSPSICNSKLK